ncbi:toll/interleukin-1 receptor domain-containing protein [Pseudofrankia sp. DC12]|uniref:toll/interleukin-1 receptor domain-containing protein n=1 Tax=Pseudofrankia sp. DC12 TaxID=683315 RepID=UPI00069752ED|nr:toll/interleukin-1 receptor domain-containing protein [Pseudofrankia sp. DC12]
MGAGADAPVGGRVGDGADFFVSYAEVDRPWAEWISWHLEDAGYRVVLQAWDFSAGAHLIRELDWAVSTTARTVAVVSASYLDSAYGEAQWQAAWAADPSGNARKLVAVRVEDCSLPGFLGLLVGADLFGLEQEEAGVRLLAAVAGGRGKPHRPVAFPGGASPARPWFPGSSGSLLAGWRRVADADPYWLGVHRPIQVSGVADGDLPAYVARDVDEAVDGVHAKITAAAERGGFVLLIGDSSVGKTRTVYEAVRAVVSDWWLVHPADAAAVGALVGLRPRQLVVWLDEIQNYLDGDHGLTAGVLRGLLDGPGPVVVVATIWPDRFARYTALPDRDSDEDRHREQRSLLWLADSVQIDSTFSHAEYDRAERSAQTDPKLRAALATADYGLTQTLAAAPQLVARWEQAIASGGPARGPYRSALLTAALDAARLGARAPLPAALLRAAAPGYCNARQQARAPGDWFEDALAYATDNNTMHGAAAALDPAGLGGMGNITGYITADYLLQYATRARHGNRPPASLWTALRDHLTDPNDIDRIATATYDRRIYTIAVPLLRTRADNGDEFAAYRLAELLVS